MLPVVQELLGQKGSTCRYLILFLFFCKEMAALPSYNPHFMMVVLLCHWYALQFSISLHVRLVCKNHCMLALELHVKIFMVKIDYNKHMFYLYLLLIYLQRHYPLYFYSIFLVYRGREITDLRVGAYK
jgi:hypothetical protein